MSEFSEVLRGYENVEMPKRLYKNGFAYKKTFKKLGLIQFFG
jgi:hypothetical protein